ncbi:polysaccharide pyruvyl transferase family protein [bacterium 210820-DFI.6.37]|nr:polysaccharide pyruvyl transferase family protein [bacterium 210820-DFI.6.37]
MKIGEMADKIKKKGLKESVVALSGKIKQTIEPKDKNSESVYKILLLTNRDSDNVGDQVIEACDIALIRTVMRNLNVKSKSFKINSRAASIVSSKYLETGNKELLSAAEKSIRESDIIIFGGAPMFNYAYQNFYERTAVTLELAEKYNRPVLFSAIGVEGYDENNEKCQRLKKTLNFDCVKLITTRDDFDALQRYKHNSQLEIRKVSDPAVFTSKVFENYITKKKNVKKKIGIFVLRANGFKDNHVDFSKQDAAKLWIDLIDKLEYEGYDYELLTSGHFGDEAFLDLLITKYGVKASKCVFNMNSPERLIGKISSYDAVISTRLHPSIISFSLGVPSVGIVWNSKVSYFYESIGYKERTITVEGITSEEIVEKVEQALVQGINKDKQYLASVYESLFLGVKRILCPDENGMTSYTYTEIIENIPPYKGTSQREQEEKIKRKFRRTYRKYNDLFDKNQKLKKQLKSLNSQKEEKPL